MTSMWSRVEPLLSQVQKPARYIGCEDGAVTPRHAPGKVSWLLAYPDTYEIGLPNQGLQILYEILNERDDAVAERAYAPWGDLESLLRSHDVGLFSVDTHRHGGSFDVIAFNLAAELTYTNVLNMVDLAGVPVRTEHRRLDDPFVVVGGHCAFNPEP
ncbi:MAG: B12-binding domain-containing radical SAM protein, partial [Acidimicrobiia bacterium]|nr:B12-binding domain-containing radical SAM protein [Acidimicrobiia bacterium]